MSLVSDVGDSGMQISSSDRQRAVDLSVAAGNDFQLASQRIGAKCQHKVAVLASTLELANDVVRGLSMQPKTAENQSRI